MSAATGTMFVVGVLVGISLESIKVGRQFAHRIEETFWQFNSWRSPAHVGVGRSGLIQALLDKKRDRSNIAPPDFSVAGKHVLITGGTGGIGGAFAKAFLDHGANVIVADLAAPKDGTESGAFRTNSWTCATMLQLKHLLHELKS